MFSSSTPLVDLFDDADVAQVYVKLLCRFEPRGVLSFIALHEVGVREVQVSMNFMVQVLSLYVWTNACTLLACC